MRVLRHQLGRLLQRHALLLAQLEELLRDKPGVFSQVAGSTMETPDRFTPNSCALASTSALAPDQRHLRKLLLDDLRGRLHRTWLRTLGQHDVLDVGSRLRLNLFNDRHVQILLDVVL